MKIIFYLLGEKGYQALRYFVENCGSKHLDCVIAAKDTGVENDFFEELQEFCKFKSIKFLSKSDHKNSTKEYYSFAIGWRWLIPEIKNLIVFHDSLLPKYRGFSPLVNMLINGEKKIGVTGLYAVEEYDKGDIIWQKAIDIEYPIKIQQAITLISLLYGEAVVEIFNLLKNGHEIKRKMQEESEATYSLWRDENDYFINWETSSQQIQRFCDAVGYPFKNAMTFVNGKKIKILEVEQHPDVTVETRDNHIGKIIFMEKGMPIVVCKNGLIKIKKYEYIDNINSERILNFRSKFATNKNDSF